MDTCNIHHTDKHNKEDKCRAHVTGAGNKNNGYSGMNTKKENRVAKTIVIKATETEMTTVIVKPTVETIRSSTSRRIRNRRSLKKMYRSRSKILLLA